MQTGVQEDQAEEFVRIFSEIKDINWDRVASKEQVTLLEKNFENIMRHVITKADMHQLEKRLVEKNHQSERRLMLMVGGAVVTICTFIAGALKYLPHLG